MTSPHGKMGRVVAARSIWQNVREPAVVPAAAMNTGAHEKQTRKRRTHFCSVLKGRTNKEACLHDHRTMVYGHRRACDESFPCSSAEAYSHLFAAGHVWVTWEKPYPPRRRWERLAADNAQE